MSLSEFTKTIPQVWEPKGHLVAAMYLPHLPGHLLGKRTLYGEGKRVRSQEAGGNRRHCWIALGVPPHGTLFRRRHLWNGAGCLHLATNVGPGTNRGAHSVFHGLVPQKRLVEHIPRIVKTSGRVISHGSEYYTYLGYHLSVLRLLV